MGWMERLYYLAVYNIAEGICFYTNWMGQEMWIWIIVFIMVIVVAMMGGLMGWKGLVGGLLESDYEGATWKECVGRSVVYESGGLRYKVYPLCCTECRKHAEAERAKLEEAQRWDRVPRLYGVDIVDKPPHNNTKSNYQFMVMRMEGGRSVAGAKMLNFEQFKQAIETAKTLGVDTSLANVVVGPRGVMLADLDRPMFPKTGIETCMDSEVFGEDRQRYMEWKTAYKK
jgi:hypothetical protein